MSSGCHDWLDLMAEPSGSVLMRMDKRLLFTDKPDRQSRPSSFKTIVFLHLCGSLCLMMGRKVEVDILRGNSLSCIGTDFNFSESRDTNPFPITGFDFAPLVLQF